MKTHKTNIKSYNDMVNVRNIINNLCERIDRHDIDNAPIIKLVDHNTFILLFVNVPCKGEIGMKTAKQIRRMIDTWFSRYNLAKYQIESLYEDGNWHYTAVYNDDLDFAKRLHDVYADWSQDIRIRNNFTGELIYRQGHNWVTFAK